MKNLLPLIVAVFFALSGAAALARVNVNTATQAELEALPEVGPVKAKAILDYRKKNGPFKSLEDLQKVNGVGPVTAKALKDHVGFSGPSTPVASEKKATAAGVKPEEAPKPQVAKPQAVKPASSAPAAGGKATANAAGADKVKDKPLADKLKDAQGNKNKSIATEKAKPQ